MSQLMATFRLPRDFYTLEIRDLSCLDCSAWIALDAVLLHSSAF